MGRTPVHDEFTDPVEMGRSVFLLVGSVLVLLVLGSLMVYSAAGTQAAVDAAGRSDAFSGERSFAAEVVPSSPGQAAMLSGPRLTELQSQAERPLRAQLAKVAIALLLLVVVARSDCRFWMRWCTPIFLTTVALVALTLVVGTKVNGARRWLRVDFLPFALQPSEFARLGLILFLAGRIHRFAEPWKTLRSDVLIGAAAVLGPGVLLLAQRDLGNFALFCGLGFTLVLLSGLRPRHLGALLLAGAPLVALVLLTRWDHVIDRFTGFVDPAPNSQLGYSLSALAAGGFSGVGLGAGRHQLFYLPECENDFIFAVIGEELGFLGTSAVILLYVLLLWSGARILLGIRHRFGFFVVAGVLCTILLQALVNIAVATCSGPTKGVPLPFVSSGGSSLTALSIGIGLVLCMARQPDRPSFVLRRSRGRLPSRESLAMKSSSLSRTTPRGAFGDLERYGLLAIGAGLLLLAGFLVQGTSGQGPPVAAVRFGGPAAAASRAAGTEGGGSGIVRDLEAEARLQPIEDPRAAGSGEDQFDFFEPPVPLPGTPAPAAGAPATAKDGRLVVVRKGDTLEQIAARELGASWRWRRILEVNDGVDPRRLQPGQVLHLPDLVKPAPRPSGSGSVRLYKVQRRDTLERIARRELGDSRRWQEILEANRDRISSPTRLRAGQTIRIPPR